MLPDHIQTFLQNGFANWPGEVYFWIGFFPTLFILAQFKVTRARWFKPILPGLKGIFALWSLAWFARLFVIIFQDGESVLGGVLSGLDWSNLYPRIWAALQPAYAWLDGYLAPFTTYVLFVVPILTTSVIRTAKITFLPLRKLLNTWEIIAFLGLTATMVSVTIANPYALILFLALVPLVNLFGVFGAQRFDKRYAKGLLLRDFTPVSNQKKDGLFHAETRSLTLAAVITAFWFHLTLAPGTLIGFYATAIGGLLAIVGFAALVFTFTHERMPTPNMGRKIGHDTRAIQTAAGATLMCAIGGMLVVDGPLTLSLRQLSGLEVLQATLLVAATIGFVYAIDGALALFQRVVDVMVDIDDRDTSCTVIFEEAGTPLFQSATGDDKYGHVQMREHLEVSSCKTIVAQTALWVGIAGQKNPVLVLARTNTTYGADPNYKSFVEQGGTLVVLADRTDLARKSAILGLFGFDVTARPTGHWKNVAPDGIFSERTGFAETHRAYVSLCIRPAPGDRILAETAPDTPGAPYVSEPFILSRRHGQGQIILVGSLTLFSNENIEKHRTFRILDRLLEEIPASPAPVKAA